jgi:hypothetical protein
MLKIPSLFRWSSLGLSFVIATAIHSHALAAQTVIIPPSQWVPLPGSPFNVTGNPYPVYEYSVPAIPSNSASSNSLQLNFNA